MYKHASPNPATSVGKDNILSLVLWLPTESKLQMNTQCLLPDFRETPGRDGGQFICVTFM